MFSFKSTKLLFAIIYFSQQLIFLTDFTIYSKRTFMYMMYMNEFQDKYIIYKHHHNV